MKKKPFELKIKIRIRAGLGVPNSLKQLAVKTKDNLTSINSK
jgi:hypothetical protein